MSMPIRLCPRGRHGFDQPFVQNSTHLRMEPGLSHSNDMHFLKISRKVVHVQ